MGENVSVEEARKIFILLYKPPPQPQRVMSEHYLFFLTLSKNEKERNFGEHSCYLNLDIIWIFRLTVLLNPRKF